MTDNLSPLIAATVQQWLTDTDAHGSPEKCSHGDDVDALLDTRLAEKLYDSCARQLSLLSRGIAATEKSERQVRRRATDVETQFRLFGRCFEANKLEACFADEDLLHCVLDHLITIGTSLLSDDVVQFIGRSPLAETHAASSGDLFSSLVARAQSVLAQEVDSEESATTSETSTDDGSSDPAAEGSLLAVRGHLTTISNDVATLMELVPTLEATYKHRFARRQTNSARRVTYVSHEAFQFVVNVRDKFPNAHEEVLNRLGEANWQRHNRLRNISVVTKGTTAVDEPASVFLVGKVLFRPHSIFHDSALGSSLQPTATEAKSTASHRSFATSADSRSRCALRVPQIPLVTWDEPFTCPFCLVTVSCSSRIAWKRHVFDDLQAYTCTWPGCSEQFTVYRNRETWAKHELDSHLSVLTYHCSLCSGVLEDEKEFWSHSRREHDVEQTSLKTVALATSRRLQHMDPAHIACQLCSKEGFASLREYSTHVGKHLEETALVVLPPLGDDDSASDVDSLDTRENRSDDLEAQPDASASGLHVDSNEGDGKRKYRETCPVAGCEYHLKGFTSKSGRSRHVTSHYRGKMVCGFCPGAGSTTGPAFSRVSVFKRHLTEAHDVEISRMLRRNSAHVSATCSICHLSFADARPFYYHLNGCVLNKVEQALSEGDLAVLDVTPSSHDGDIGTVFEKHVIHSSSAKLDSEDTDPIEEDHKPAQLDAIRAYSKRYDRPPQYLPDSEREISWQHHSDKTKVEIGGWIDATPSINKMFPDAPSSEQAAASEVAEAHEPQDTGENRWPKGLPSGTVTMAILSPGDPDRKNTIPRLGFMDTAAKASFTFKSVLDRAGLPYYHYGLPDKSGLVGLDGSVIQPIGSASLYWYENVRQQKSANDPDPIHQTMFLVLPDCDTEPNADFVLGREWLEGAQLELVRRQETDNGGTISALQIRDQVT